MNPPPPSPWIPERRRSIDSMKTSVTEAGHVRGIDRAVPAARRGPSSFPCEMSRFCITETSMRPLKSIRRTLFAVHGRLLPPRNDRTVRWMLRNDRGLGESGAPTRNSTGNMETARRSARSRVLGICQHWEMRFLMSFFRYY